MVSSPVPVSRCAQARRRVSPPGRSLLITVLLGSTRRVLLRMTRGGGQASGPGALRITGGGSGAGRDGCGQTACSTGCAATNRADPGTPLAGPARAGRSPGCASRPAPAGPGCPRPTDQYSCNSSLLAAPGRPYLRGTYLGLELLEQLGVAGRLRQQPAHVHWSHWAADSRAVTATSRPVDATAG